MPFYIRKSFKAGPLRLNLSKSGLGLSFGVKGLRVGSGPGGSYLHGGRNGLYFRESLSPGRQSSGHMSSSGSSSFTDSGCLKFILVIGIIVLMAMLINWGVNHSTLVLSGLGIAVILLIIGFIITFKINKSKKTEAIEVNNKQAAYYVLLESIFLSSGPFPDEAACTKIVFSRNELITSEITKRLATELENEIYQSLLNKVLEDQYISEEESKLINLAERILEISPDTTNKIKKEVFSKAYQQVIQDKKLTKDEISRITNLIKGLGIPDEIIPDERDLLDDLIRSQEISMPLPIIPVNKIPINIPSAEAVHYVTDAKILELRKLQRNDQEESFVTVREGPLVITDKRIVLSDQGSTNIRFSDIAYINVDLATKLIEITKSTSRKPIFLEVDSPFVVARVIDLLMYTNKSL